MKRTIVLVLLTALGVVALAACGGGSDAVGVWVGVDTPGFEMELKADGTGFIGFDGVGGDMTWESDGEQLCFTFEDGSGDCKDYTVDGDRMSMESFGSGGTTRLERWTK